jgi:hypothetical protein
VILTMFAAETFDARLIWKRRRAGADSDAYQSAARDRRLREHRREHFSDRWLLFTEIE